MRASVEIVFALVVWSCAGFAYPGVNVTNGLARVGIMQLAFVQVGRSAGASVTS